MTVTLGVLGDTHCESASDLPDAVLAALAGVDLVVHLGDLQSAGVLDRLEGLAPVVAVPGRNDEADDRLSAGPVRTVDVDGMAVAVVRSLAEHDVPAGVGLVLHGGTHDHEISVRRGVLYVNPGSTRFAARLPTVARVVVDGPGRTASAEVVALG